MNFLLNVQEMNYMCIMKAEHGSMGVMIVAGSCYYIKFFEGTC
jgi:hypothetical protein